MNLRNYIKSKGYNQTWRFGTTFPDQNAGSKSQVKRLFESDAEIYFVEGDKTTPSSVFYFRGFSGTTDFSSMTLGGIDIRYVKDYDFDSQIIWGLHEYGFPPTLISPRPKIKGYVLTKSHHTGENEEILRDEISDALMTRCIEKEDSQKVFEAMFDKSILFDYTRELVV